MTSIMAVRRKCLSTWLITWTKTVLISVYWPCSEEESMNNSFLRKSASARPSEYDPRKQQNYEAVFSPAAVSALHQGKVRCHRVLSGMAQSQNCQRLPDGRDTSGFVVHIDSTRIKKALDLSALRLKQLVVTHDLTGQSVLPRVLQTISNRFLHWSGCQLSYITLWRVM